MQFLNVDNILSDHKKEIKRQSCSPTFSYFMKNVYMQVNWTLAVLCSPTFYFMKNVYNASELNISHTAWSELFIHILPTIKELTGKMHTNYKFNLLLEKELENINKTEYIKKMI